MADSKNLEEFMNDTSSKDLVVKKLDIANRVLIGFMSNADDATIINLCKDSVKDYLIDAGIGDKLDKINRFND